MIFQILTSFGAGIALGAKPDISQAVSIAQRNIERQASQRAAEASAREKEFDEFAKDMEDFVIDPTKFDPYFIKPLQLAGVKLRNAAMEAQAVNPQNYRNTDKFQKAFFEWQKEKASATIGTEIFADADAAVLKNQKGLVVSENYEVLEKARQTGDYAEVRKLFGKSPTTGQLVSFEAPVFDILNVQEEIISSVDVVLQELAPKMDVAGNWIYTEQVNEEAYRRRVDAQTDLKWRFTPSVQAQFPAEEGEQFSQEFRDIVWQGRETPKLKRVIRKPKAEKVKKGWNINTGGWNNKKYAFGYSVKETTDPISGAQKKEETINLEYLGTPDLSKLEINIKGRPLLGRITLFEVQDGKVIMSYKTTEKHPGIPETQEEGAVVIKIPFEGKVKKEVETKYQFEFDSMINEVRGLQGVKDVSEVEREDSTGRVGIFNAETKEFIRWK